MTRMFRGAIRPVFASSIWQWCSGLGQPLCPGVARTAQVAAGTGFDISRRCDDDVGAADRPRGALMEHHVSAKSRVLEQE